MVELSGNEKREIRGILKTRPIDLKVGKRGLTHEFIRESSKILGKDTMIKLGLPGDKELQKKIIMEFSQETSSLCIAKVGKTAAFYQHHD
jgi:RNA-binding protein YhbY